MLPALSRRACKIPVSLRCLHRRGGVAARACRIYASPALPICDPDLRRSSRDRRRSFIQKKIGPVRFACAHLHDEAPTETSACPKKRKSSRWDPEIANFFFAKMRQRRNIQQEPNDEEASAFHVFQRSVDAFSCQLRSTQAIGTAEHGMQRHRKKKYNLPKEASRNS